MSLVKMPFEEARKQVRALLENPLDLPWETQGLGMLRLRLADCCRLHVWDPEARIADVAKVHNHARDFTSLVIAGEMINRVGEEGMRGATYYRGELSCCGADAKIVGTPQQVRLAFTTQAVGPGSTYSLRRSQIHASAPAPGTVTVIHREEVPSTSRETVLVFWPAYLGAQGWVSAAPRKATPREIEHACWLARVTMARRDLAYRSEAL